MRGRLDAAVVGIGVRICSLRGPQWFNKTMTELLAPDDRVMLTFRASRAGAAAMPNE
jgi:hypothetical protein